MAREKTYGNPDDGVECPWCHQHMGPFGLPYEDFDTFCESCGKSVKIWFEVPTPQITAWRGDDNKQVQVDGIL